MGVLNSVVLASPPGRWLINAWFVEKTNQKTECGYTVCVSFGTSAVVFCSVARVGRCLPEKHSGAALLDGTVQWWECFHLLGAVW